MRRRSGDADPEKVLRDVWARLREPGDEPDMSLDAMLPVDPLADMAATRAAVAQRFPGLTE